MSKYDPLSRWLTRRISKRVPATFTEIEEILGFPLPPAARKRRPWWANDRKNHVQAKAWLSAGFHTEDVSLPNETLVFVRS
jgi:hypothetical protein